MDSVRARLLGEAIRAARQERQLTQEGLAAATGLTPEHLRFIELGRGNPTLATVYAIADSLGVPAHSVIPD